VKETKILMIPQAEGGEVKAPLVEIEA